MKISFPREPFANLFAIAGSVAPARSPKPILQNVKLEVTREGCTLLATDLEIGVRVRVEGIEVLDPGQTILPIQRFNQILRESHDKSLQLEVKGNGAVIRGERMKFKLDTESPEEFPEVADFQETKYHQVSARLLKEIIRRTAFATDTESSRYALGGVLFEMGENQIIAVGTDGRRLARMQGPAQAVGGHDTVETQTIVPTRALQLIERSLGDEGDVLLSSNGNTIMIKTDKLILQSNLVQGRFPRWRDVFPNRPHAIKIPMQVGPLLDSVRQAAIVTSEESRGVNFHFGGGQLKLNASTAQVGESEVAQVIAYDGPEIDISLDPRFVIDFLKVLHTEATMLFEVQDGTGPGVLSVDDGYAYVIMPLSRDR